MQENLGFTTLYREDKLNSEKTVVKVLLDSNSSNFLHQRTSSIYMNYFGVWYEGNVTLQYTQSYIRENELFLVCFNFLHKNSNKIYDCQLCCNFQPLLPLFGFMFINLFFFLEIIYYLDCLCLYASYELIFITSYKAEFYLLFYLH